LDIVASSIDPGVKAMADPLAEVFRVSSDIIHSEVGGGHGQKGVEFQRHWAVMRMFELEKAEAEDFLILFEAIQDIAEQDSETEPTSIRVYQLKKKDRGEWGWAHLTALQSPPKPKKTSTKAKNPPKKSRIAPALINVKESPLGKLYMSMRAFQALSSTGHFLSNAGCDLPLAAGGKAATSLPIALSMLSLDHAELIERALATTHNAGEAPPDLSRLYLERVTLPVDEPGTHLVGIVHKFLERRSPRHAGQARALVDALLAQIAPLGAKTDACHNFTDLRRQRGYSKSEFLGALGDLESVPDQLDLLETWLNQLQTEGMGFMEVMSIRLAATAIFRRQVMGRRSVEEEPILRDCDDIVASAPTARDLLPLFRQAEGTLAAKYPSVKPAELMAHFALRALGKCAAQI
jgi:hypothetical protein